ncbi:UDP-N-acetylmuramate dehydrogenase [Candidatus Daviesbacteria bacterium]|nr:UDP-N-acetylmuramate dehydrogenase [Candidatus Daviesbacteria bacterium]
MNFQNNYLLSQVTTLKIGGPAKEFVSVQTEKELIEAITYARQKNLPFLVIGGGSNLLVADEGVEKLVIQNRITGIFQKGNNLIVKSGTILQDLVNFTIEKGLTGINKLTGVPGTVGGAIYGNAGAYGSGISDKLVELICFDPTSEEKVVLKTEECGFGYRDSNFKRNNLIILEANFDLTPGNLEELKKESEEIKRKRDGKYPPGIKCPGSFYKNFVASELSTDVLVNIPKEKIVYGKVPAGALLEMVGAKGDRIDGIEIASYHANLFINNGTGTAKDFYNLAKKYAEKVKQKFGITLEPEVQLINLPPIA